MGTTLQDVARRAGVSMKTVSNVVHERPYVKGATRERVLEAISALGYVPNMNARSLRYGKTDSIALIIPYLRNAYFAELSEELVRTARQAGLSVIIELSGGVRETERELIESARARGVDGIIISPLSLLQDDAAAFADSAVPIVLLGESLFDVAADHVLIRNVEATQAATDLLIRAGHKRILALGTIAGSPAGSASLRSAGYRAAFLEADLPIDESLLLPVEEWDRTSGATALRAFLDNGGTCDAIVAFTDGLAFGALDVLDELGLSVPGDVALVGFDNLQDSEFIRPSLTTIDPGRPEIAQMAVQFLLERISGSTDVAFRKHFAAYQLIERSSTR